MRMTRNVDYHASELCYCKRFPVLPIEVICADYPNWIEDFICSGNLCRLPEFLLTWLQIQLGFSRSLGSEISNEANKSAMLNAEWTIAAHSAVLHLPKMKYQYFVSGCCKQNVIFSGTSHQNRAYLDNISTNL